MHSLYHIFRWLSILSSLFIAPQNLRFESGGLICFFIYKIILDKLVFPSYNALTAEEKSHWDLGLFSLFSTAFRIYFLTTSLTIVRFGLRGFSITREHLFPWFCLHAITKRYYLTLKKLKTLGWGGRGRKLSNPNTSKTLSKNLTQVTLLIVVIQASNPAVIDKNKPICINTLLIKITSISSKISFKLFPI